MLSPGYSILRFSLDEAQTKERSLQFCTFVLWYALLLEHPGELIYDLSPKGTKQTRVAVEM